MYDCNELLQRLSQYLDGDLPAEELAVLQLQAQEQPECQSMFEAMMWVHRSLEAAPMVEPSRDFAVSVTRELAWRQRRDKAILAAVLGLGILTIISPLLILLWAGAITMLEPDFLSSVISWGVSFIGNIATYGIAIISLFQHLPQWSIIIFSLAASISFLLLALTIVMQKSPELLFAPNPAQRQQA